MNKLEKSWVFYDWANSAYSLIVTTTIFPLYFKAMATAGGIADTQSTAYIGFANSLATLVVAFLAPILGAMADYYGFKKRLFLGFLAFAVTATACLGILPESQWMLALFVYIITAIGFSGTNVFYDSFLVDVTEDARMDRVSTMGYALGYIGSTIPFILVMAVLILSDKGILPFEANTVIRGSFFLTALWWTVFSIPMIKNVKQIHGIPREASPVKNTFKRLFQTFKEIKKYKSAFTFLIAYFFYIDGVDTIIKMATAYGSDLGVSSIDMLIILLVTQFVAFPSAILYGKLAQKYRAKKMLYVAIFAYSGICLFAVFMKSTLDFWILAMVVGLFQGGIQAISRSYFARLVPKHKSNEFFGLFNIFGKFAAIMGPALVGVIALYTKSSNYGAASLIILFVAGGLLLSRVKEEKAL